MRISKLYMTLAVLAVTGCSGHKAGLPLVQMEEVAQNGANGIAVYPGRAVADENSSVAFRVSGTIEKILVEPGQNVKKGTMLPSWISATTGHSSMQRKLSTVR